MYQEPNVSELAAREAALRAEIMRGPGPGEPARAFVSTGSAYPHGDPGAYQSQAPLAQSMGMTYPEPDKMPPPVPAYNTAIWGDSAAPGHVDVPATRLMSIDFIDRQVRTSFGTFTLSELEGAVLARVVIASLERNLSAVLDNLAEVHNVNKLAQAEAEVMQQVKGSQPPPSQAGADPDKPSAGRHAPPKHAEDDLPMPRPQSQPAQYGGDDDQPMPRLAPDDEDPYEDPPSPDPKPVRRRRKK